MVTHRVRAPYIALAFVSIALLPACLGKKNADDPAAATSGATTTGSSLSTADLAGSWVTDCIAVATSGMHGPAGYAGYRDDLQISGTAFTFNRSWYTTVTNGFCGGSNDMEGAVSGTLAVGQPLSASSDTSTIQFIANSTSIRAYTAPLVSALNTACGLTGGSAMVQSTPKVVTALSCGGTYPVHHASGTVDNVVRMPSTTRLSLGAFSLSALIPGVIGTPATTATITFAKY